MRSLPHGTFLDEPKHAPIVLVGKPAELVGRVRLKNRTPNRAVISAARIYHDMPRRSDRGIEDPASPIEVSLVEILEPSESSTVTIRAALEPQTPPGNYDGVLHISATENHPVRLHVFESIQLEVVPSDLVIENRPGTSTQARLGLVNSGNTPLNVQNIGAVPLDDELLECKAIRATLAKLRPAGKRRGTPAEPRTTIQDWVTTCLEQGGDVLDAAGLLGVDVEAAPLVLAVGETAIVELRIRIPASVDPRSRYHGVALLQDTQIKFTLAPCGAEKRSRRAE